MADQGYAQFLHPIMVMRFENESAEDILQYLKKFSYETAESKTASLTLEFSDPEQKLIDDPRIAINKPIKFRFGYSNKMSNEINVVIKEIKPSYDQVTNLTVRAFDLSVAAKNNTTPKNWGRNTTSQILTAIADRYGYDTDIDPTYDLPTKDRIQPGKMSDLEYAKGLANRLNRDFFIDGTVLRLKENSYQGDPSYVFEYTSEKSSIVKSFKPNVKAYKPPETTAVGTSDKKKEKVGIKTADSGEKKSGQTVISVEGKKLVSTKKTKQLAPAEAPKGVSTDVSTAQGKLNPTPETKSDKLKESAKGMTGKQENKQVDASLDIVGHPLIKIRDLIRVEGVSRRWVGGYRVASVKHDIGDGGYSTSLGLRRNALGEGGGAKTKKQNQAKQGNKETPTTQKKVIVVNAKTQVSRTEIRTTQDKR